MADMNRLLISHEHLKINFSDVLYRSSEVQYIDALVVKSAQEVTGCQFTNVKARKRGKGKLLKERIES